MTCTVCDMKGHNKRYHGKQPTDGDVVQQDNILNDITQIESTASFSIPPANPTPQNCTLPDVSQLLFFSIILLCN